MTCVQGRQDTGLPACYSSWLLLVNGTERRVALLVLIFEILVLLFEKTRVIKPPATSVSFNFNFPALIPGLL